MLTTLGSFAVAIAGAIALMAIGIRSGRWLPPHLRIDDSPPVVETPPEATDELDAFVAGLESRQVTLIPEAAARITWAAPDRPDRTPIVFLYLHGFSASRLESAPVCARLASHYGANLFEARIAGHGCGAGALGAASARDWLRSTQQAWAIASALGDRVIIVSMSNGASLATWLLREPDNRARTLALLMMAPNFRVRSRVAGLLSLPLAPVWVPRLVGRRRGSTPTNEAASRIWTHSYPVSALFQMQTMVHWLARQDLSRIDVPLALMYMENDPTVDPNAARSGFRRWGSSYKELMPVEPEGDAVEHVFVGDALAPQRNDWVVTTFTRFLDPLVRA